MDIQRAANIATLKEHPGFQAFVLEVEEKRERFVDLMAKKMMSTGEPYPDFEYERGYWAGLQKATGYPDLATRVLKADADKRTKEQNV